MWELKRHRWMKSPVTSLGFNYHFHVFISWVHIHIRVGTVLEPRPKLWHKHPKTEVWNKPWIWRPVTHLKDILGIFVMWLGLYVPFPMNIWTSQKEKINEGWITFTAVTSDSGVGHNLLTFAFNKAIVSVTGNTCTFPLWHVKISAD